MSCRLRRYRRGGAWRFTCLALALTAIAGCRHETAHLPPPPPPLPQSQSPQAAERYPPQPQAPVETPVPQTEAGVTQADLEYIETHKPILSEIGMASWYRDYKGRKQANGELLDDDAMTAANRTLPLGSLVMVTNLKTGQSGAMHITDRGPFIEGRVVDLSIASAKAVGIYRDGIDRVRVDVYRTPKSIWTGGRWCVQIGIFTSERRALAYKRMLMRQYPRASVIDFAANRDEYWVRVTPHDGDRDTAVYVTQHAHPSEGVAFLTRLD